MRTINRFGSILSGVLEGIVGLLLLTVLTLAVGEVVSRWVTRQSLVVVNELNRFIFTWLVFLAIPAALNRGIHFRSTLLSRAMPRKVRIAMEALVDAIVVIFSWVLISQGLQMVARTAAQHSNILNIQMSYMYSVFPICGALMIVFLVLRWVRALSEGHFPDPAAAGHGDDSATAHAASTGEA